MAASAFLIIKCPHRCAALFLGRNEESGIRCIYHGWKFDVDGNCIEMPNVPPEQDFKAKIKAKSYRTQERAGLVWVYMGDREVPPPLPMIEVSMLPEDQIEISMYQRECNWLQSLEGDIDTAHFGFLHAGHVDADEVPEGHPLDHTLTNRAPAFHVQDTPWGTSYGAYRQVQQDAKDQTYWRFANFMFPFWTQQPQGTFAKNVHARAWVPMDDTHTMFISIRWRGSNEAVRMPLKNGEMVGGSTGPMTFAPRTTDWFGRYKVVADPTNDWLLDREAQTSNQIFSGIDNIHLQDQAVTESMGPITDHAAEHLGPSDLMIARTRRRALRAARALRADGVIPPGIDEPGVYLGARSGFFLTDREVDWAKAYATQVADCVRPAKDETSGAPQVEPTYV